MAYDPALSTLVDHLRFQMGDIDDTAPLFPVATYQALLDEFGYLEALARIAETRYRQLAGKLKSWTDGAGVSETKNEPSFYMDLAKSARSGSILAPNLAESPMNRSFVGPTTGPDLTTFRTD